MSDDSGTDGYHEGWYSEDSATFGDRLAGAREAAGLGQADLARRVGIQVKTLRNWENDLSEPRANRLQMMAGLLNVSITWLLTGQGEGLDAPPQDKNSSVEVNRILLELRQLRTDMKNISDRASHLEKQLRSLLSEKIL